MVAKFTSSISQRKPPQSLPLSLTIFTQPVNLYTVPTVVVNVVFIEPFAERADQLPLCANAVDAVMPEPADQPVRLPPSNVPFETRFCACVAVASIAAPATAQLIFMCLPLSWRRLGRAPLTFIRMAAFCRDAATAPNLPLLQGALFRFTVSPLPLASALVAPVFSLKCQRPTVFESLLNGAVGGLKFAV